MGSVIFIVGATRHQAEKNRKRGNERMTKQPYIFGLLLPTLSPAAKIAVFTESKAGFNTVYAGTAIKARDVTGLSEMEVRHIGINERCEQKAGERPTIEIFVI